MEAFLVIVYTAVFIFFIRKMKFFEVQGISKNTLSAIFILKIVFGLLVWVIYTFYYTYRPTADIYKYFDASKVLFDTLKTHPDYFFKMLFGIDNTGAQFHPYYDKMNYWSNEVDSAIYNDNRLIIRINTVIRFFSFGYFNVHTVFFCFLSLIGLTAIYKTFVPVLQDKKRELLAIVFFLPSVLFWGSGVLKEGVILFSLGVLVYQFNKSVAVKSMFVCLVMALLLGVLKFYVLMAVLPGLVYLLLVKKTGTSKLFLKFITVIGITAIAGLNIDKFTPIKNPLQMLSQKQNDFNQLAAGKLTDAYNKPIAVANSAIKIDTLEPTVVSLVKNSPQAVFNALFLPFVWQSRSPVMLLAAIENMLVMVFILLCLLFAKPVTQIRWEYVLFCLLFSFTLFLFIGLTTPIVGAIARYKIIALPFLLIAFLLILDKEKIKNKFSHE